jgi:hypothetical protein
MSAKEELDRLAGSLPEERIEQLLEYARFLCWQEERRRWSRFGQAQLARAYGPDEPEYTEADVKVESGR